MIDPYNDQLPVGLIAQLVEHCTGVAEVRVRVPSRPFLHHRLVGAAKTAKITRIKIGSIRSANEISLIWSVISTACIWRSGSSRDLSPDWWKAGEFTLHWSNRHWWRFGSKERVIPSSSHPSSLDFGSGISPAIIPVVAQLDVFRSNVLHS